MAIETPQKTSDEAPSAPILGRPMVRLALAGATGLFLELAVIRWAGAHVLYLSYVANFMLLSAFFGLGLGCLLAPRIGAARVARFVSAAPAVMVLFALLVAFVEVQVVIEGTDVIYFSNERLPVGLPAWITLPLLGLVSTSLFVIIGTAIGRELDKAPPLRAYSTEIGGSMVGIAVFTLLSFTGARAALWFAAGGVALILLGTARRALLYRNGALVLVAAGICAWVDGGSDWSPYYRVSVFQQRPASARHPGDPTQGSPVYRLKVNNITHQYISDIRRREPFYEFPYRAFGAQHAGQHRSYLVDPRRSPPGKRPAPKRPLRRVLIIGAGTGTDTAFALAYGAQHVDSVEIDRVLAETGRRLHPNRPYSDPRVTLHIGDARTFLERANQRYDLIVFGLPDSLTLASPYAGLRLESFLFTRETFAQVRRLLEPGHGLFVAYNYYRKPWLVKRIAATIGAGFGAPPRTLVGPDRNLSSAFFAGPGQQNIPPGLGSMWGFRWRSEGGDAPSSTTRGDAASTFTPTDDWPFLYVKKPSVAPHLVLAMGLFIFFAFSIVALALRLSRGGGARAGPKVPLLSLLPFFLMGVAFLLLETAGLVRMSLLFGTTWLVNALVFFAVLAMVLLANLIAHRFELRRPAPIFVVLLITLVVAWYLPPSVFASWPMAARYLAAAIVLFVPILLANLVFSRAFRQSANPALSFGANLVGAVLGGALEYLSLLLGYRSLFLVGLGLYVAVWLSTGLAEKKAQATIEPAAGQP